MSNIQECGKVILDFIDYMNMKYQYEDSLMVKSHIGFSLIMLKDLIELIEVKSDIPINVYNNLNYVEFYNNQSEIQKLIINELKKQ